MASDQAAFLFDVDNTLVDNDHIQADMASHLERAIGAERNRHYWELFEELRTQLGYADYLGALQRYRVEFPRDFHILAVSDYLINYPFANRLYPNSLDVVFQPLKVHRSGLYDAFDGHVMIYIHKEFELDDIVARYPASHYVLIDDKVRILSAVKKVWGARVTTVFPRQGHYAFDAAEVAKYPTPDDRIGALLDYDLQALTTRR